MRSASLCPYGIEGILNYCIASFVAHRCRFLNNPSCLIIILFEIILYKLKEGIKDCFLLSFFPLSRQKWALFKFRLLLFSWHIYLWCYVPVLKAYPLRGFVAQRTATFLGIVKFNVVPDVMLYILHVSLLYEIGKTIFYTHNFSLSLWRKMLNIFWIQSLSISSWLVFFSNASLSS